MMAYYLLVLVILSTNVRECTNMNNQQQEEIKENGEPTGAKMTPEVKKSF